MREILLKMHIDLPVKYRHSCQILINLEFYRHVFEKYSNINFHENPSSGNRVVACGRTDVTNATVTFDNFAIAPTNRTNAVLQVQIRRLFKGSKIFKQDFRIPLQ